MKKILAVVLAILTLCAAPMTVYAATPVAAVSTTAARSTAAVSLNKTQLKIYTKNSYQLKLRNTKKKVKWSSSAPEIASVDQTGVVTAHKKGTAVITAVCGKKKYTCAVTVKNVPTKAVKAGYTITKKKTTIKTDRFTLIVDPGVYLPDNAVKNINAVMDTVEEVTGMSFYSDFFKKQNPSMPKVKIIVVKPKNQEYYGAWGGEFGVEVSAGDLLIENGEGWALLHELTHCIHRRNGYWMSQTMNEALSTYCTLLYAEKFNLPYFFDAAVNYNHFPEEITAKTAEELFIETDKDGWNAYLFGYRLMQYFAESYGMDEYFALAKSMTGDARNDISPTNAQMAKILKKRYGKDFFTKFGAWYEEHQEQFEKYEITVDLSDYSRIDLYPFYGGYNFYELGNFTYDDYLVVDLSNGFEYIEKYKKDKLTGSVTALLSAQGETKAVFYSADGKKLKTVKLGEASVNVTVEDAALIRFSGDGKMVYMKLDFDQMVQ